MGLYLLHEVFLCFLANVWLGFIHLLLASCAVELIENGLQSFLGLHLVSFFHGEVLVTQHVIVEINQFPVHKVYFARFEVLSMRHDTNRVKRWLFELTLIYSNMMAFIRILISIQPSPSPLLLKTLLKGTQSFVFELECDPEDVSELLLEHFIAHLEPTFFNFTL